MRRNSYARTPIKHWSKEQFTRSDKLPMIVFGNAMFNKDGVPMRGQRVGVTNILWKTLKRRERQGHLVAITIDEYLTSQVIYANMKLRESIYAKTFRFA